MLHRVGIELEILAPAGSSRLTLAVAIADAIGGEVIECWHVDTEPSAHQQFDVFHHLTPAFEVRDKEGEHFIRLVNDVTIHADLVIDAPSLAGWRRVLSDDPRFLRMIAPSLPALHASEVDVANLCERLGLVMDRRGRVTRFADDTGASVAMVTDLPGEKHRVTECISPPLVEGFDHWIETVVGEAARLGFTVPSEGATHFHYDAEPFRSGEAFRRLVYAFGLEVDTIRAKMQTNPRCRRLGALPSALVDFVESEGYEQLDWEALATQARTIEGITKYADVNVLHLLADEPKIDTVEFRMLPSTLDVTALREMRADVDRMVDHFVAG